MPSYVMLYVYNNNWFDTIYHEHLDYHSVKPLIPFFNKKETHDELRQQKNDSALFTSFILTTGCSKVKWGDFEWDPAKAAARITFGQVK